MKILLAGDTHGSLGQMKYLCETAAKLGADRIVQLGDFGYLWPGDESAVKLQVVSNLLTNDNLELYFLDGNHDWHPELERRGARHDAEGFVQIADRVTYLPRGFSWEWGGKKFLACGGAFSVDKKYRRVGVSWWYEEDISYADVERCCSVGEVDILLTHDAPAGSKVLQAHLARTDGHWRSAYGLTWEKISRQSLNNRIAIQTILEATLPKVLFHGHYHFCYTDYIGDTEIHGLDCHGSGDASWRLIEYHESS